MKKGLACALVVSAGVAIAAPYVLRNFTTDATVLAAAVRLQWLGLLLETGRVFNVVAVNGLRATGDGRYPLLTSALSVWGLWVPLAWWLWLSLELGLDGLCVAMICDEWLRGVLNYGRWRRRGWVRHAEHSRALVVRGEQRPDAVS